MEFGGSVGWRARLGSSLEPIDSLQEEGRQFGLRVGPAGAGHSAAAIMIAATGIADDKFCFRGQRTVAAMDSLTEAAGMRRSRCGCKSQRAQVAYEGCEQQESGDQAVHVGAWRCWQLINFGG